MKKLKTEELLEWDRSHLIHSMAAMGATRGIVFDSAEGVILRDTEGKEYIDSSAQMVNVNIGHGRKEVIEAIGEQLAKLQYTTTYWGFTNTATILCAKKLAEITPSGLKHFFFTSGGSEAVETAFKIARNYWHAKKPEKHKIISLYNSFHGVSFGTLSATSLGMGRLWKSYGPLVPGFLHIPSYYCYRCAFGLEYPGCRIKCADFLAETIENEGRESVAGFIAESVQGPMGMINPPPEYWPKVRQICSEMDVLLIADEVMSGFGRTGKLFAVEHWGVVPDIMTMAKGITSGYIPFGAVAINDEIYRELQSRQTPFSHGFTYSGHPVGAAAAIKDMEIIVGERLAENAARIGEYTLKRLQKDFLPIPCIGEVNGLGLMIGIEYVEDKKSKAIPKKVWEISQKIQDRALQDGLFLRVYGNRVTLSPPLIINQEQMDRILAILKPILAGIPEWF
ncbi:MAG: aspartate aminotransferase family protein [Deltaproteobacteria bacterium]|nr:aspartate aminotransferase family protein [Deltaproteobacteria bacterium]